MIHPDSFSIAGEQGPRAYYSPMEVSIDDDGDVWIGNEDGTLLISLDQAFHLHFKLGQLLIANARNTYGRNTYQSLQYAAQEQRNHDQH
ncbi:hypothetical protein GGR34_000756 [Microvirga flocculans]|uniref:Uncharacterized protein n=1 Tax=Microvirga flocculans TaxID=217168 RepID=A0A7W6N6Z8_9HYPH|nr:hypothetical protein [Microvirga flocculans]MBB4039121.1 hypothetical protein [Microvirga flocculans]